MDYASDALTQAMDAIRSARVAQLRSAQWLEHELLPHLGLSEVTPDFYPAHLRGFCGQGIRSFQLPNQFSKYLCHLSRQKISTYLEIGVWQGGTFVITVEYLARFNDLKRALAVDVTITDQMRQYARLNERVTTFEGDSKTRAVKARVNQDWWDLALIDGDHSEQGCFNDYQTVRDSAGMIALHDVYSDLCPEVGIVWQRLAGIFPRQWLHEFNEQYVDVLRATNARTMGIGLVDLRGSAAQADG